jgi:hypothetical protein
LLGKMPSLDAEGLDAPLDYAERLRESVEDEHGVAHRGVRNLDAALRIG